MLISRVSEVNDDMEAGKRAGAGPPRGSPAGGQLEHDHEYQTADELFELMAKNHPFQENDENTLSKRDLVILYKNIDIGTTLMSNSNEQKNKKPNQHVETIIFNEDPESDDSDISENYTAEDLQNVVLVNKERMDLFNNRPSLQNTLCHKLADLEIQSSDLATEYDNHFLFKDPYIKEQLKNLNLSCCSNGFEGTILPASLLDYICCKRLEDNHNFYMDNIIRYVTHTIDQLKRISNGDYLTDKAKEKWREVEYTAKESYKNNDKALATSTSIPLYVERKFGDCPSTWDDLVHSEVDVRSLSKILEKRIVVEIPKLIYGSYRIFSKRCDDNLMISCKRDKPAVVCKEEGKARVDLVLKLQRSQSGFVMSNISSILSLQTSPTIQHLGALKVLPSPNNGNYETSNENEAKIIELKQPNVDAILPAVEENEHNSDSTEDEQYKDSPIFCNLNSSSSENQNIWQLNKIKNLESSVSSNILNKKVQKLKKEASSNLVTPDELWLTIQKLNIQSSLPEESSEDISINTTIKKKSLTRVRIKSPYENKSFAMEEKKRKKLLEIREKREKKKIALVEKCKITKHKYGKAAMPQASSSVTKLSITNKSFYNSIYGQANVENIQQKKGRTKRNDNITLDIPLAQMKEEYESPMATPEKNSKKFINRSYYLDEAVTEVMFTDMKKKESKEDKDLCSASTSGVSNDIRENLTLLSQLMAPSSIDLNINENRSTFADKLQRLANDKKGRKEKNIISPNILNMVPPTNSPVNTSMDDDKNDLKRSSSSVECRKSIDKIYDLIKKLEKMDQTEIKGPKCKFTDSNSEKMKNMCGRGSSTIQGSDSGTSVKHHLNSSNPSCFSFEKVNNEPLNIETMLTQNLNLTKKPEPPTTVVPKVVFSSKIVNSKMEKDGMKKERKKVTVPQPAKGTDNPLKAISQLIHGIDNVQKLRQKIETKSVKKTDQCPIDGKSISRQTANQTNLMRQSRLEEHFNDKELLKERYAKVTPRDRKIRPIPTIEVPKTIYQHSPTEEKNIERLNKKKIIDIVDEAKEARGEAVRGPSKLHRLNSLAQPKRSYVQAHSEEYQTKYGKNMMADRLHRLAAIPATITERTTISANSKYKLKRSGAEVGPPVCGRPPPLSPPPLDRASKVRGSRSSCGGGLPSAIVPSLKTYVPDSPEILKKNLVSVESYVKNHYGRVTQATGNNELLQSEAKSRVPLIPSDIELESMTSSSIAEESTQMGRKLRCIVNTMINKAPGLAVLTECHETASKNSKTNTEDNMCRAQNISQSQNNEESISSDYSIDVFEDSNILTAVENFEKKEDLIPEEDKIETNDLKSLNSANEMEKLESALYSQMSGTFQKRLRLKNLTLTPKQSLQQVFVVQSGDAASLLVKSTVAQNDSNQSELKSALATLPILTNSHLDWSFAKFPMQIATVEYGVPEYQQIQYGINSKIKLDMCRSHSGTNLVHENSDESNKTSQCFQGQSMTLFRKTEDTNSNKSEDKLDCKEVIVIGPAKIPKTLSNNSIPTNDKNEEKIENYTSDTVDYTSSLDVLVGLLNEIQNITSCQAHLTNSENNNERKEESTLSNAAIFKGAIKSRVRDLVSMSSLDELRQLESNSSIYSFYLSNNGDRESIDNEFHKMNHDSAFNSFNLINAPYNKPIYADKEINVDFLEKTYLNRLTDNPHIFLKSVNHSTSVTNSLVCVLNGTSSQSTNSFMDYESISSNSIGSMKKIIELRQVGTTTDSQYTLLSRVPEANHKKIAYKQKINANIPLKRPKRNNVWSKKIEAKSNFLFSGPESDPLFKMKRDVLVTVYSILMFTVFAALSFPQMLYRT